MDFREYEKQAASTAIYSSRGSSLCYPALGLAGEAGEVAEKVKKLVRKDGLFAQPDEELRQSLSKELGDLLWYISALCFELGVSLDDVANMNLKKLSSRKERGVLHGEGDER